MLSLSAQLGMVVNNYPPLYHYTKDQFLADLLDSKSLLARPTSDFNDTDEYILGLKFIAEHLKLIYAGIHQDHKVIEFLISRLDQRLIKRVPKILEYVIANIEFEIANVSNPRVKVYVACLTTDPLSEKMRTEYGRCIIPFNFLLPFFAYSVPQPFTSSMLSRVTYSKAEFIAFISEMGFGFVDEFLHDAHIVLHQLSINDRINAVACWITERLCLFAPNIKRECYAYENEYRLKSSISTYSNTPNVPVRHPAHSMMHLPKIARFKDDAKSRYFHQLTDHMGNLISPGVMIATEGAGGLPAMVDEWERRNAADKEVFFRALGNT
ncbi:MAG: hypothetical protein HUU46_12235 [Candidatus Hydrogenedentes bacterium]|nr:hypothetical protein [Candidatus Hydrogenedentota bacterium]